MIKIDPYFIMLHQSINFKTFLIGNEKCVADDDADGGMIPVCLPYFASDTKDFKKENSGYVKEMPHYQTNPWHRGAGGGVCKTIRTPRIKQMTWVST